MCVSFPGVGGTVTTMFSDPPKMLKTFLASKNRFYTDSYISTGVNKPSVSHEFELLTGTRSG